MKTQWTQRDDEFGRFSCYDEDGKHWLADEQTIAETAILYDADDVIYDENQGYLLWHTGEEAQWADGNFSDSIES